jgi:hypothetical protein
MCPYVILEMACRDQRLLEHIVAVHRKPGRKTDHIQRQVTTIKTREIGVTEIGVSLRQCSPR